MRQSDETLRDQIFGGFLGCAIGDAVGAPVETKRKEEIRAHADGRIAGYVAARHSMKDTMSLPPGATTDDTQLFLATARGVMAGGGFNPVAEATELAHEFDTTDARWGGTIRAAGEGFSLWNKSVGKEGRDPRLFVAPLPQKEGEGIGTAPSMRVGPIAMWNACAQGGVTRLIEDVMRFGRMTHGDPRASYAALAVACAIQHSLRTPYEMAAAATGQEAVVASELFSYDVRRLVLNMVLAAERTYAFASRDNPVVSAMAFSERLRIAIDAAFNSSLDADAMTDRIYDGFGSDRRPLFSSMAAVPLALAFAFRYPDDFERAVLGAVNAGGDTDTTAAIAGAIVGCRVGASRIPAWMKEGLLPLPKVMSAAGRFAELAIAARNAAQ